MLLVGAHRTRTRSGVSRRELPISTAALVTTVQYAVGVTSEQSQGLGIAVE